MDVGLLEVYRHSDMTSRYNKTSRSGTSRTVFVKQFHSYLPNKNQAAVKGRRCKAQTLDVVHVFVSDFAVVAHAFQPGEASISNKNFLAKTPEAFNAGLHLALMAMDLALVVGQQPDTQSLLACVGQTRYI